MSKTLGRVLWDALPPDAAEWLDIEEAEAAADAVVKYLGEVPCGIDCGRSRTVIEAARAQERAYAVYVEGCGSADPYRAACVETNFAVAALDSDD